MAQIETWYTQDLEQPVKVHYLDGNVFSQDNQGNVIGVEVFNNGNPAELTGSVSASIIRSDGGTVAATGALSNNKVSVTLPAAAYAVPGVISIVLKLTSGAVVVTLLALVATVYASSTDAAVDPGTIIPSIADLIDAIEAAVASIPADYSDLWESLAPAFDSDNSYKAGQYATYNGHLYRFLVAHSGNWNSNHAIAVDLGNDTRLFVSPLEKFLDDFVVEGVRTDLTATGTQSKYWNCETDTAVFTDIANTDFRAFDAIPVASGEVYTIYSRSGQTHKARTWLITDDNYKILASPGDTFGVSQTRYVIVVPTGGTKLLLTTSNLSDPGLKKLEWHETINTLDALKYRGSVGQLGYTSLTQCNKTGWYGCGATYAENLLDLPTGYDTTKALTLFVMRYAFNSGDDVSTPFDGFHLQILVNAAGYMYMRYIVVSSGTAQPWHVFGGGGASTYLTGKKVAIIGDSISTNGNTGSYHNVPEITITSDDVGVELSAYLTYYDVQAGLTLGGHTFTSAEIGTEVTFTPISDDIGKSIGLPNNYNPNSTTVWWEVAMSELGFIPIPVCWSGASITAHEGDTSEYKTSFAWHDAQIRKCGIRTPGSMARTAPDVIIIYRGTNDFSHAPYARLTAGYFDNYDWSYPASDYSDGVYGYKEGLALTVKKLRIAYPNAKIILCTLNVFKRVNYSHFPTNNGYNSLPQYNDAIREVADFFGCDVIDFDRDGITFENCYSGGYITDSSTTPTHPSNKGHWVMGQKAIADLNAKYNPMDE